MAVNSFRECPVSRWHGWTSLIRSGFRSSILTTSFLFTLSQVEKEIVSCLKDAGSALAEVAKDKPSQKQVNCDSDNEKQ